MRIALLILLAATTSCKNDMERVAAIELPATAPDRVTTNAEYFYSDSGRVSNRLRAGKIEEFIGEKDHHTVITDGLELLFYTATGAEGSVLRARRGRIWPDEHRMQVQEQVVFTNALGETLETEELLWWQDSARVHTDRPVKVTRKSDVIHGDGLDAAEDFSSYTILKPHGILEVPSDTLAP